MTYCTTCQREFSPEDFSCHLPCKPVVGPRVDRCKRVVKGHMKRHQSLPICLNYTNPNFKSEQRASRLLANRPRRRRLRQAMASGATAFVNGDDNADADNDADGDVDAAEAEKVGMKQLQDSHSPWSTKKRRGCRLPQSELERSRCRIW